MSPSETIYLDNAATSFPKPESMYAAMDAWQRQTGAAFGRGSHGVEHANALVQRCRHQIELLIGSPNQNSVAFTFSTTDGLNLLLRGILRPEQHVLTTTLEHNSVLRPLMQLQEQLSVSVDYIPFDPVTGLVDPDEFERACRDHPPDLVVINTASNVTGIAQHVKELTDRAKAAGALVLLDVAQSIGHVPIDVQAIDADLLAAPGHKGLYGPLGTGFVYVSPVVQDRLTSFRCGGTGTNSESIRQPASMPELLESGNLNMPGIAGLSAALGWRQTDEYQQLHDRHQRQMVPFISRLQQITGVTVHCGTSAERNVGVVSLTIGSLEPQEAAMILSQSFGIQCRAGLHCAPLAHQTLSTAGQGGTIRLSPGLFSTEEHLEQAIDGVTAIASTL